MTARPKSASGFWTGPIGLLAGIAALFVLHGWVAEAYLKTVAVMAICGLAMVIVDVFFYRTINRNTVAARPFNWHRIAQKLVALALIYAAVIGLYWLLPIYADQFYDPFKNALILCAPFIIIGAPFYIAITDSRLAEPDDGYVDLARLIGGTLPANWEPLLALGRGWLVKFFFLPLMFCFCNNDLIGVWSMSGFPALDTFQLIYDRGYELFYLIDVLIAGVGYAMTFKLLDTQIKSAEPTLAGWVICLVCYQPFWDGFFAPYLRYDQDGKYWGNYFFDNPIVYPIWGSAILALVLIYAWATVSFGLRFSNLTHRGIITHGPYRWVKHPAYLSKNLSWWMISMPFVAGTGDWGMAIRSSILLGAINVVYLLRAITEERHLARDPIYREYQTFIAEHGLFAIIRRRLFGSRETSIPTNAAAVDK